MAHATRGRGDGKLFTRFKDCFRPNISPPCDATVESKPRFPGNSQSLGETVAQPVVAGEYDDIHKAEEVRLKLLKMQQD